MSELKKSKSMCNGCYNDDYNRGLGGSKECWSYKKAKIIKRIPVHVDQRPPYDATEARDMLNCFKSPRMCYPEPTALTSEGYWKW